LRLDSLQVYLPVDESTQQCYAKNEACEDITSFPSLRSCFPVTENEDDKYETARYQECAQPVDSLIFLFGWLISIDTEEAPNEGEQTKTGD
jgi:hypothetical protein